MQVVAVRRSGVFNWYFNGEFDSSVADTSSYTPAGGSALVIGRRLDNASPAANASLSLVRISATAPTPQQIKEIYEAEKPLFAANAKCLLQSTSASLPNVVHDLSYDKSTDLLSVSQYVLTDNAEGMQRFSGLEMVDMLDGSVAGGWSTGYTTKIATAGGVTAGYHNGTPGGVVVDLPSIDVRAELNEGESKIPDDGKFHFSGSTTTATSTVIGQIPISENESVVIRAKVWGKRYNMQTSSWWLIGEIVQNYYRDFGGNVIEPLETPTLSLIDEGQASLDFTLEEDTGSNTVQLKVTGTTTTLVWTAEVEVQRISDKTYER